MKCNLFLNGKAGETPLSLALLKWDFELADILLNKGVTELTRISFEIDGKNSEEESRFAAAFHSGWYSVADFLLQHGAAKPAGFVVGTTGGDPNIEKLKWLVEHGFDINELNEVWLSKIFQRIPNEMNAFLSSER